MRIYHNNTVMTRFVRDEDGAENKCAAARVLDIIMLGNIKCFLSFRFD